jgi:uncharacterized membrane-anchored protein
MGGGAVRDGAEHGSGGAEVFEQHPRRAAVLAEAHARPFHASATPSRLFHYAFTTDAARAEADRRALAAFCREVGRVAPAPTSKHHSLTVAGGRLRWEQHSEFTTYTWEFAGSAPATEDRTEWMRRLPQPGPLVACVDLRLTAGPQIEVERWFEVPTPAMSYADEGAAIIAGDFSPDAEGFVRIVVADLVLTPHRAGALVQRLLELETYRTFALLGLPEAQRLAPAVTEIEQELAELTLAMTVSHSLEDNHALLQQLTALAARLEAGAAASVYRFGASRAYAEIVRGRLEAIDERAHPGLPTFAAFMSRRLAPAMRICKTVEVRQADLSRKLARAAQLLRARIDIELQHQNRDLLASVNTRSRIQLHLQTAVETLSVAAASYYAVGLLEHVVRVLPRFGLRIDPDLATAAAVPIATLAICATFLKRRRVLGS